jgi:hypothetical protein
MGHLTMRISCGVRAPAIHAVRERAARRQLNAQVVQHSNSNSFRPLARSMAPVTLTTLSPSVSAPLLPLLQMGQPRNPAAHLGVGSVTWRYFLQLGPPKPKTNFSALPEAGSATTRNTVCITMRVEPRPALGRRLQGEVSVHHELPRTLLVGAPLPI